MANHEETIKMIEPTHYLPIYNDTTLPQVIRSKQNKSKLMRNSIIVIISMLLIGAIVYGLYKYSFNDTKPENTTVSYSSLLNESERIDKQLQEIEEKIEKITSDDYPNEDSTTIQPQKGRYSLDKFNSPSCGRVKTAARVQNGEFARLNEFPWVVALYFLNKTNGNTIPVYGCGGSLISDDLILTAAHCLELPKENDDLELKFIRLGELNFDTNPDCDDQDCTDPIQDIYSENFSYLLHPDYDSGKLKNDIGLIHLKIKANLNQRNIETICLPFGYKEIPNRLFVTGFGEIQFYMRNSRLKFGAVEFVANTQCEDEYLRYNTTQTFDESQFCALGKIVKDFKGTPKVYDIDSCKGDSGSPIQSLNLSAQMVQHGIVSGGLNKRVCGINTAPGFYTKVSHYLDWIKDNSEGNY